MIEKNKDKIFTKGFCYAFLNSEISYRPKNKKKLNIYRIFLFGYALLVLLFITLSSLMLIFNEKTRKDYNYIFILVEISVFIFLLFDFIVRWIIYNYKFKKKWSVLLFPISLSGILSILTLLPSLYILNIWMGTNFNILKNFEALKFFRIFRIALLTNIVPGIYILRKSITKEKKSLLVVVSLVLLTLIFSSLIIYNFERNNPKIKNYFDSLYFTTMTLTTIGYGDIAPITTLGKVIVMSISFIGVSAIAISSGIIASSFIEELKELKSRKRELEKKKELKKKKSKKKITKKK